MNNGLKSTDITGELLELVNDFKIGGERMQQHSVWNYVDIVKIDPDKSDNRLYYIGDTRKWYTDEVISDKDTPFTYEDQYMTDYMGTTILVRTIEYGLLQGDSTHNELEQDGIMTLLDNTRYDSLEDILDVVGEKPFIAFPLQDTDEKVAVIITSSDDDFSGITLRGMATSTMVTNELKSYLWQGYADISKVLLEKLTVYTYDYQESGRFMA
mgnify:CR=1 FL=1